MIGGTFYVYSVNHNEAGYDNKEKWAGDVWRGGGGDEIFNMARRKVKSSFINISVQNQLF